jgi:lysophospholipase L1-like esterase
MLSIAYSANLLRVYCYGNAIQKGTCLVKQFLKESRRPHSSSSSDRHSISLLEATHSGRILAFGDSLTAGTFYDIHGFEGSHPYGTILAQALRGKADVKVSAVNGLTTNRMYRRLETALSRYPSDLIIILGGANDLWIDRDPDDIIETLINIHDAALESKHANRPSKSHPVFTMALTLPQMGVPSDSPLEAGRILVNEGLRAYAHSRSDRVVLLDLENVFDQSIPSNVKYWSSDHLHLSAAGYDALGMLIFKTIVNTAVSVQSSDGGNKSTEGLGQQTDDKK